MASTAQRTSARERLLTAADELFYKEGVHSVGIDKVIERAGVAKATLYNAFGSKDELVRAYLERRHETRKNRIMRELAGYDTPRERVLAVFDTLRRISAEPRFRGCAFINASAEASPGSSVAEVRDATRAWTRNLFADLAAEGGAAAPVSLAQQLVLLYDGLMVSAQLDRDETTAKAARAAAEVLLDAASVH